MTVISPAASCATAKASGIIVSASIARIAPAATAVVAATTSGEKSCKTEQPAHAAIPEAMAMLVQTPNT